MIPGLVRRMIPEDLRQFTRQWLIKSFGIPHAGRSLTVFENDLFIVSYPRSGNTWMRFIVANILYPDRSITFKNIGNIVPDIYRTTNWALSKMDPPRILKSHEYFDPRYRRVIYVVRDPRDVMLSLYNYRIKKRRIPEGYPLSDFCDQFLRSELTPYGTWGQNVGSWLGARRTEDDFLFLRYEDLQRDPFKNVQKLGTFLDQSLSDKQTETIIQESSYDRMSRLEQRQSSEWSETKNTRSDYRFVNEGRSGYWSEKLPDDLAGEIYEHWHPLMDQLDYD